MSSSLAHRDTHPPEGTLTVELLLAAAGLAGDLATGAFLVAAPGFVLLVPLGLGGGLLPWAGVRGWGALGSLGLSFSVLLLVVP